MTRLVEVISSAVTVIGGPGYLSRRPGCERWMDYQLGQLAEVLYRCSQRKLVVRTGGTAQPKAIQLRDALQMGEQHLDLFSIAT